MKQKDILEIRSTMREKEGVGKEREEEEELYQIGEGG
jgi:hypothetical protein